MPRGEGRAHPGDARMNRACARREHSGNFDARLSQSTRRAGAIAPAHDEGHSIHRHAPRRRPGGKLNATWISGEERCGSCRRSEEHTSELQSLMRISYAVFCLTKKINLATPHKLDTSA